MGTLIDVPSMRPTKHIFVGDKAYLEPDRVTHPRLFAVKSPELPLDITDEMLWRWSKASFTN